MKLQQRHSELEQKYTRAIATSGNASADHFVSRLLRMVADLYDKSLYRLDPFCCILYKQVLVSVKIVYSYVVYT